MIIPHFILSEPLGFHAPSLAAWLQRRHEFYAAQAAPGAREKMAMSDFFNQRRPLSAGEGFASIHINDGLGKNLTNFDRATGMTDYEDLIAEINQAAGDASVKGILLDINSPGGSAVGAPEAAAAVAEARQQKPVVSYVGTVGASAAFYTAAASHALVVSPSAIVGSVGTIAMFMDLSGLLASIGISANILTPAASDLKAAGNPFRAMTTQERAFLQGRIESLNADFTAWVSQYRPAVQPDSLRGQYFTGTEAVSRGLADYTGNRQRAIEELRSLAAL